MTRAQTVAKELSKAARLWVLDETHRVPMPNVVWSGKHFDLIEDVGATNWRRSALCHEVARILRSSNPLPPTTQE